MNVIDVTVFIVVDIVIRNLAGVPPHVRLEVPMIVVDTGIYNYDQVGIRTLGDIPRGGRGHLSVPIE
jgi:hypothetical protein